MRLWGRRAGGGHPAREGRGRCACRMERPPSSSATSARPAGVPLGHLLHVPLTGMSPGCLSQHLLRPPPLKVTVSPAVLLSKQLARPSLGFHEHLRTRNTPVLGFRSAFQWV